MNETAMLLYNKTNFLSILFSLNIFDEPGNYTILLFYCVYIHTESKWIAFEYFDVFVEELNERNMLFEYLLHEDGGKTGGGMLRVKTEHGTHISPAFNVLNSSSP